MKIKKYLATFGDTVDFHNKEGGRGMPPVSNEVKTRMFSTPDSTLIQTPQQRNTEP